MHPYFRNELAHGAAAERLRRAERDRGARAAGAAGPAGRVRPRLLARLAARLGSRRTRRHPADVRVRFATEQDRTTWPDLEPDAPEHLLVADVDGAPRAALSLVDGAVLRIGESGRMRRRRP
jgi:hypothetical protein